MSGKAISWAWDQDLPSNEKYVLVAIADAADDAGLYAGGIEPITTKTGLADSSTRQNVKRIETRGLLRKESRYRREGGRETDVFQLLGIAPDTGGSPRRIPAASAPAQQRPSTTTANGGGSARTLPPWPLSVEIPEETVEEAQAFLTQRRKVDGRIVTPDEMLKAAAAMAEFNRQADARQGLASSMTMIVGRLRDRPTWDVERVIRLVQSAFRIRWWESEHGRQPPRKRLTPSPIFGNARCFEMVIQDAQDEHAGNLEKVEARRGKYDREGAVWRDE